MHINVVGGLASSVMTQTVLVVDDEAMIRLVAAEHFRDLGYRVIEASDGNEAVEVMQAEDDIDIVFSDVMMPNCNGFELARWIRRERPGIPILFASGGFKALTPGGELSADAPLLAKPYRLDDVAAQIAQLICERI